MEILVLGGTHHVGRNIVESAVALGHTVTTVNRGLTGAATTPGGRSAVADDAVTRLTADRTVPGSLAEALGDRRWDAVLDTWSGAPHVVLESAEILADRVGHYGYVSSRSVYSWPIPSGADESADVVEGSADSSSDEDYAASKRGGELAVLQYFQGRSVLARAGLILGPYEIVGRLPWWLGRLNRGGRVLAPGPEDRDLQYIDGRDLADWMLHCAANGISGAFNAVSPAGHTTMGELLTTAVGVVGGDVELTWVSPEVIEANGVQGWTELPIWVPPTGELAALHDGDVTAAVTAGLRNRPIADTIRDTWEWLQRDGWPTIPAKRAAPGLDPEVEARVLGSL